MHHCSLPTHRLRGSLAKGHGPITACLTACLPQVFDATGNAIELKPGDEYPMEWVLIVSMADGGWQEVPACLGCGFILPKPTPSP
jgi:hypothetical protein